MQLPTQSGFTLTELVAVILILGILSVGATAMFDRRSFDSAGFADQAQNAVAYAQKVAVAQRKSVQVNLTGSTITLLVCTAPDPTPCSTTAAVPRVGGGGSGGFVSTAPAGVTLSTVPATASFTFDALGRPSGFAGNLVVTISNARTFTVEQDTGYVHP